MNKILALPTDDLKALGNLGYSVAFRILGHRDDAADAVQDAMHQMFRRRKLYVADRGSVRSWFLKIVRNRCIDMQRKSKPVSGNDNLNPVDCRIHTPPLEFEREELVAMVRTALAEMPDESREIILLRDFHGLSYAEISDILGLACGTVMSRLHRARQRLRSKISSANTAN